MTGASFFHSSLCLHLTKSSRQLSIFSRYFSSIKIFFPDIFFHKKHLFQNFQSYFSSSDMKDLRSISLLLSQKNFTLTSLSRLSTTARSQFGWGFIMTIGDCEVRWPSSVRRWIVPRQLERDAWWGAEGGGWLLHCWHLHHLLQVRFSLPSCFSMNSVYLGSLSTSIDNLQLYQNKLDTFSNYLHLLIHLLKYFLTQGCCVYLLHALVPFLNSYFYPL